MAADFFWSLKKNIEEEYHSLNLDLSNLTNDDLNEKVYIRFSRQIDHIQDLFDNISEVSKDLDLSQSNPDFYKLLEGKQALSDCYGQFNRLRSIFFKRFAKFRNQEEEIQPVRTEPEAPEEEESPEEIPDEQEDEELEPVDEYDPDAEKAEKAAERKARQKKLAEEARKRQAADQAEQTARQAEATRQAEAARRQQAEQRNYEAKLNEDRLRQEERLKQENERNAARLRDEDEAMRRTNERLRQSAEFEHLENSHIDMSQQGRGYQSPSSEQLPDEPAPASAQTPHTESPTSSAEAVRNDSRSNYEPTTTQTQEPVTVSQPPQETRNEYREKSPASAGESSHKDAQQILKDEAAQLGMNIHPEQSVSQADLQQERIRQEESRRLDQEKAAARLQEEKEAMRRTQEKLDKSTQFEHLENSHIDMSREGIGGSSSVSSSSAQNEPQVIPQPTPQSTFEREPGQSPSGHSSSSPQPFIPFSYTPSGVVESPIATKPTPDHTFSADNNAKIYSALMTNRGDSDKEPLFVSPVYETQMRFNVEQARLAYADARGTQKAQEAAHEYLQQRNALFLYQEAVKKGTIHVNEHVIPEPTHQSASADKGPAFAPKTSAQRSGDNATVYSFTPTGTVGQGISGSQPIPSRYEYYNPGLRGRPAYTPSNPMVVSAKYEESIINKMRSSTEALNIAIEKKDPSAAPVNALEAKMYSDAYIAFQKAKRDGTVVVSAAGDGPDIPDYSAWQQRRYAQKSSGTTAYPKNTNPNITPKQSVSQAGTNIFNHTYRLKEQSMASIYARQIGSRFGTYASSAALRFSQQMYRVIQSGDDNALRTMETGRYYITTAAGVAIAVSQGNPVKGFSKHIAQASAREFTLYGTKSLMSHAELSNVVNNSSRMTRELGTQIADTKQKLAALGDPANLDKFSKLKYDRLSSQLESLQTQLKTANRTHALHQGLLDLRHEQQLEREVLEKLQGADGKLIKNPKKLKAAINNANAEANKNLRKRFGDMRTEEGAKLDPTRITKDSLKKEIKQVTQQVQALKSEIAQLQAKGAALTQAERKLLLKKKAEFKSLGQKLGKLKCLEKARGNLQFKSKTAERILKDAYKNNGRINNGLFALEMFMLRPLQSGYDSNTEGLAKMIQISSNHYVHKLVKKAYKASVFVAKTTGKVTMDAVVPGSVEALTQVTAEVKASVHAGTAAAKKAVKSAVHTGVQSAGKAISNAVPQGVKTGVKTSQAAVNTAKSKVSSIATGVRNKVFRAKQWAANTRLGRGVSAVARFNANASEALKAATTLLKGVAVKGFLIFFIVFIAVGIISLFGGVSGGVASSAVIAAPYEGPDGKIDLSRYVEIIAGEQAGFQSEIDAYKSDSTYDNVFVNYSGPISNTKEMLSMMAVRMSQELDLDENPHIEEYLVSLFKDSHTYTTSERHYKCAGCKTRMEPVVVIDPETGLETWDEIEVTYCPGHIDLTINISVLTFDEIYSADTYANAGQFANAGEKIGNFTITYYCCEKYPHICNAGPPYKTATGTTPTANRTIAVDPSVIPLGSHVIIDGREYVAEDTGGAIKGNRIDIVVATHKEALRCGKRQNVPVYAPNYEGGSYEETGVWEGWTEDNKDWCELIYNQDWNDLYCGFANYGDVIESGDLIVSGDFIWPVTSTTITSDFGYRNTNIPGASTYHKGVDIAVPTGTPVHASAAGVVTVASYQANGAGYYVFINHGNGIVTKYMHHSQNLVSAGQRVEAGQVIALSGSTGVSSGPHLHFQFEVNGTPINPRKQFGI